MVVKKTFRYSNVFFYNRTRAYAAIPQLRNFEHYYEKRYKIKKVIHPEVAGMCRRKIDCHNVAFLLDDTIQAW